MDGTFIEYIFLCEICEIFKNTYFEEHLRTTASVNITNIDSYNERISFFLRIKIAALREKHHTRIV